MINTSISQKELIKMLEELAPKGWSIDTNELGENVIVGLEGSNIKTLLNIWKIKTENQVILDQIAKLEIEQTPRRLREAALSQEGAVWLQNLENQIKSLRIKLKNCN